MRRFAWGEIPPDAFPQDGHTTWLERWGASPGISTSERPNHGSQLELKGSLLKCPRIDNGVRLPLCCRGWQKAVDALFSVALWNLLSAVGLDNTTQWRRLVDDFRTLIASGFEFPILSWCPPSQENPSEGSKTVDTPKQCTTGKNLESPSQSLRSGTKLVAAPNDYRPADQPDSSDSSRTGNDLNGSLQAGHLRSEHAAEPGDLSSVCRTDPSGCSRSLKVPEHPIGSGDGSCNSQNNHASAGRAAESGESGTSQESLAVSGNLLARYDREELYEKVWTMSVRKVAEEYGVAHTTLGRTLKRLHIPIPPDGYRSRKATNKPLPARPPLPKVHIRNGQIGRTEPNGPGTSQRPCAVSRRLLARYNREQLYEKVWMMPLWRVAEEYRVSRTRIVETCKSLHIPVPGVGYWGKKAANKPLPVKSPLPEILGLMGPIGPAEISRTGAVPESHTVSAGLMTRYNREELYEKAWEVPMLKLAEEYGVSNEALGKTCRKLHIPVPGRGYWAMKAANRAVDPKPPLPKVQIKSGRSTPKECPQSVGVSMHGTSNKEPVGLSALSYSGAESLAKVSGADNYPQHLTVSRLLMSRYDRQDLYERVWSVPMVKLQKELGISGCALSERCERLHIPVPGPGYWQKKRANKPVEPRPPLPVVQIR